MHRPSAKAAVACQESVAVLVGVLVAVAAVYVKFLTADCTDVMDLKPVLSNHRQHHNNVPATM